MNIRCPHCRNSIATVDDTDQTLASVTCPDCNSDFSLIDTSLEVEESQPRKIEQFEFLRQLGVGAFGAVWLARDTELHREVAVKIPRQGALSTQEMELFLREARSAAQLTHQNIVGIHEVGRSDQGVYIVSDYIDGVPLDESLEAHRPSFKEAAELCAKIADALHHAHERGVIHRDLKPGNIMIDKRGEPHIMDFGIAKRDSAEVTMTVEGQILGTPAYMPPEQADGEGHRVDRRADVYSLGVILYEIMTGERPFRGSVRNVLYQAIHEEPPSPRQLNRHIPRDLETICLKCMSKAKRRRYATAEDLAEDLRRWLRNEPIVARRIGPIGRAVRWSQRNPLAAAMVFLVIAVTIAGFTGVTWQWRNAVKAAKAESIAKMDAMRHAEDARKQRQVAEQNRDEAMEQSKLAAQAAQDANAQRATADAERKKAEALALREQQQRELAIKEAENAARAAADARRERNRAETAKRRAEDALKEVEKARDEARMAKQELEQAASKAYVDISRHFAEKGQYELVIANYRAATELGLSTAEHEKLFQQAFAQRLKNLDDTTDPATLSADERAKAAALFYTSALAARNTNDFAKALQLTQRALRFDPNNAAKYRQAIAATLVAQAQHLVENRQYSEAVDKYHEARNAGAAEALCQRLTADAFVARARDEIAKGRVEQALQWFERASAADPNRKSMFAGQAADACVEAAEAAGKKRDVPAAVALYLEAAKLDPANGTDYRGRAGAELEQSAQLALKQDDPEAALKLFRQAAQTDAANAASYARAAARILQSQAAAALDRVDYELAVKHYLEAAKTDPENADAYRLAASKAYFDHASALLKANAPDYDKAIEALNSARKLDLGNRQFSDTLASAYFGRALEAHRQRKYKNAVDDYSSVVRLAPKDVQAHLGRANSYFSLQEFAKAAGDYSSVIELDPDNSTARRFRFLINSKPYRTPRNLAHLLDDAEALIGADAGNAEALNWAAILRFSGTPDMRNGAKAVAHATALCELKGYKNPEYLSMLASAHAQAENVDEAVKFVNQAIELATDDQQRDGLTKLRDYYQEGNKPPAFADGNG